MIISASRRTDIPAFYSEWFMGRLKEGHVLVPNPYNAKSLRYVKLTPQNVDCIVFWTKNPLPMLDKFTQIDKMGYSYYTQFTLTPYDKTVEPNLPPKIKLINAFSEMSKKTSDERVVWRYDPVIIGANHTVKWHIDKFCKMCHELQGFTKRCVLSFVHPYKSLKNRFRAATKSEMTAIADSFSAIAKQYGITLFTCAQQLGFSKYGIERGACIDKELIEQIIKSRIAAKKDLNQREACHCIRSVDIGAYDTCINGCTYCYATSDKNTALNRIKAHDPDAPMILGYPKGDEAILNSTMKSQKIGQLSMF